MGLFPVNRLSATALSLLAEKAAAEVLREDARLRGLCICTAGYDPVTKALCFWAATTGDVSSLVSDMIKLYEFNDKNEQEAKEMISAKLRDVVKRLDQYVSMNNEAAEAGRQLASMLLPEDKNLFLRGSWDDAQPDVVVKGDGE